MVKSLIEAHLFGSMKEAEECDYDHTWIDDSSAQGGDKENCSVGEVNLRKCKDVVRETDLMQLQVENGIHEDVELQSELQHTLDVLIDEDAYVEMPSQSNVDSVVAYVERESRTTISTLPSQLNSNQTLSKDWWTWVKVNMLYEV